MRIGTKSVLYGAHCFFIHPWFVALAWWKLYGFPWDPRLWFAFFLHDIGYLGKPNMDGEEGESHVLLGARIMHYFFDPGYRDRMRIYERGEDLGNYPYGYSIRPWEGLCLYHSRFWAKKHDMPFSSLCVADKLAVTLEPFWLYLPRVIATGEIKEYMSLAVAKNPNSKYNGEPQTKYSSMNLDVSSRRAWHRNMVEYLRLWVAEHKDGRDDTWTPGGV